MEHDPIKSCCSDILKFHKSGVCFYFCYFFLNQKKNKDEKKIPIAEYPIRLMISIFCRFCIML